MFTVDANNQTVHYEFNTFHLALSKLLYQFWYDNLIIILKPLNIMELECLIHGPKMLIDHISNYMIYQRSSQAQKRYTKSVKK